MNSVFVYITCFKAYLYRIFSHIRPIYQLKRYILHCHCQPHSFADGTVTEKVGGRFRWLSTGGTAYTVMYAQKEGLKIVNITDLIPLDKRM